ncbi:MAG: hypothetical protein ACYC6F_12995 [Longimicrobiales bacterium]
MPLTRFQRQVLALLARNRSPESYLAGGAALHFAPNSLRYSDDLDYFHDSERRVTEAFHADSALLHAAGYGVEVQLSQPGFLRAMVTLGEGSTRVDWAHDSAWRFMPPVRDALGGFILHDVDLAVNKVLALAGRDEPRDFVDILFVHERVLPLGALCWAAAGKDPGFTPLSLLELLRRRGRHRPEEIARLDLTVPVDLVAWKATWLAALDDAEVFVRSRPGNEVGCLYFDRKHERFVVPAADLSPEDQGVALHFGSPGGVLPRTVPDD